MTQATIRNDAGDPPASFTEWCAVTKQVVDRRSAADGRVRMVHTKQNEAIDCPSTPDLTLVLIVGQEIALPINQYIRQEQCRFSEEVRHRPERNVEEVVIAIATERKPSK